MLASPATSVAEALADTATASVEWKLDGARIQAHRAGDEVRLYTRNLNDVTDRLGGVVDVVRVAARRRPGARRRGARRADDGTPRRFQDTMGDFGADAGHVGRGSRARSRSSSTSSTSAATPSSTSRCAYAASPRGDRAGRSAACRRSSPPTRTRRERFLEPRDRQPATRE